MRLVAGGGLLLLVYACASRNTSQIDQEAVNSKVVTPSFYTLKEGRQTKRAMPLPNNSDIEINWTYSDKSKKTNDGFRGWDFDHDGRFDMLEVLDGQGAVVSWAYDFDGDGIIDKTEQAQEKSGLPVDDQAH